MTTNAPKPAPKNPNKAAAPPPPPPKKKAYDPANIRIWFPNCVISGFDRDVLIVEPVEK